jgi:hypothetical protein
VVSGTGNQSAPLSAGPSGLFLASYPIGSPVEVRKWTGSAFGAAVQVSTERASGVHIRVARNGDVHVIYAANDGNEVIRHVVSTDGGATWSAPQTVGRNTTTRPWAAERVAAAPSGTGFVAMETDSTGTNEPLGFVDLSDLGGAALPGSGTSGGGGGGTGGGGTVPVLVTRSVTLGNQTFTARVPTTCVKAGQNLRMTISRKTKKGAKPVPGFKVRRLDQLIDGKRRAYVIASNVGKVLAKGYLDYHTGKTKSFPALKAGKHVAGLKILFKYKKGGKKKKGSSTLKLPFTICP